MFALASIRLFHSQCVTERAPERNDEHTVYAIRFVFFCLKSSIFIQSEKDIITTSRTRNNWMRGKSKNILLILFIWWFLSGRVVFCAYSHAVRAVVATALTSNVNYGFCIGPPTRRRHSIIAQINRNTRIRSEQCVINHYSDYSDQCCRSHTHSHFDGGGGGGVSRCVRREQRFLSPRKHVN